MVDITHFKSSFRLFQQRLSWRGGTPHIYFFTPNLYKKLINPSLLKNHLKISVPWDPWIREKPELVFHSSHMIFTGITHWVFNMRVRWFGHILQCFIDCVPLFTGLNDLLSSSNGPQDSSGLNNSLPGQPPTIPQRPAPQPRAKSALPQVSLTVIL